jgi:hypothetical protein
MSSISNENKWMISIMSGVMFAIIASPELYILSDSIFDYMFSMKTMVDEVPTKFGILVHSIIFLLITRLLMG